MSAYRHGRGSSRSACSRKPAVAVRLERVHGQRYGDTGIRELWGRFYSSIDTAVEAAAFQIALWELSVDDVIDLAAGNYQAPGSANPYDAVTLAGEWLAMLDGSGPLATLRLLANNGTASDVQDLITERPGAGLARAARPRPRGSGIYATTYSVSDKFNSARSSSW